MKAMVATYFAKIDSTVSENIKKCNHISNEFDKF